ncbi:histamine H2 receptor-like [Actinia tenebrosa]|uniref:Histamine H2 receptor-like n=1 Tax=Actinia tenebrosa TaxID=6105 RepID=A0A6P8J6T5_ACTTE|nr:histamine H2 receptor-like [Actinia tenebrosa]
MANHSNASTSSPLYFREAFEIQIQVFFLIIILVTTVVGNTLVIIIIWLDHRLHTPGFYFLANLSVADLLLGIVYSPFYISSTLDQKWLFFETWCKLHAVFISTCFNASLVTLSFVSLDRFMAITKPLRYQSLLTTRRSLVLIALGWVHSIFWAAAPLVGWGEITLDLKTNTCRPNWNAKGFPSKMYANLLAVFTFALPSAIMVYCYFRIFKVARHQVKLIKRNSIGSSQNGPQNSRPTETRALRTVLMVLGAFVLAWLPYTIVSTGKLFMKTGWDVGASTANAVLTTTLVNGCFNPIIYAMRDRRFKSGLQKIICPFARTNSLDLSSYVSSAQVTAHVLRQKELGVENVVQSSSL